MKRKFVALLLAAACLMAMTMGTVSAAPAEEFEYTLTVDEQGNIIEPKAGIILNCGLNKVSGSTYYAWASASGDTFLSVSVFSVSGQYPARLCRKRCKLFGCGANKKPYPRSRRIYGARLCDI